MTSIASTSSQNLISSTAISSSSSSAQEPLTYEISNILDDPSKYPQKLWQLLTENSLKLSEEVQKMISEVPIYMQRFRQTICEPLAGETIILTLDSNELFRCLPDDTIVFPQRTR